jgi:hypothetical protein
MPINTIDAFEKPRFDDLQKAMGMPPEAYKQMMKGHDDDIRSSKLLPLPRVRTSGTASSLPCCA